MIVRVYRKIDSEEIDFLCKFANPRLRYAYATLCIGGYHELPYTDWASITRRKKKPNVEFMENAKAIRITQVCAFPKMGFSPIKTTNTREEFTVYMKEVKEMRERAKDDPNNLPRLSEMFMFSLLCCYAHSKKIYGTCFFCICV